MTARDNKKTMAEGCPKQEADIQDTCAPCEAAGEAVEDAGCDACE